MITVEVTLSGRNDDLYDALVYACRYYSQVDVQETRACLTYICETLDTSAAIAAVQDSINIDLLDDLDVEVESIRTVLNDGD